MTEQATSVQERSQLQLSLFQPEQRSEVNDSSNHKDSAFSNQTLVYLLALASLRGIGFRTLCQMFDTGFLWDIWQLDLSEVSNRYKSLPSKVVKEVSAIIGKDKEKLLQYGETASEELHQKGISFISSKDKTYPKPFFRLQDPPRWIFIKGNPEILYSESIIALVGTREPSQEGQALARRCAEELAKRNFIVLSGLARGIDECVHSGAVSYYGQSIAVLGHGLEAEDAYNNKQLTSKLLNTNGAIISEYLLLDSPSRDRFLRRNELVAALAKVVIPVETPSLESGTGSTIRRALKIKTHVIGLTSPYVSSKSLTETKNSLTSINVPIFTVGNGSTEFWKKLEEIYPKHNWNVGNQARQEQFFREILKQVEEVKDKISLDNEAIDRLAEQIKNIL